MSMGVHHPYHLDLCADEEDPFQLIIRPGWDAPHIRCFPRTFCAWPCLLRQVGTVLGSPYDCVVARLAYANPGSRQSNPSIDPHDVPLNSLVAQEQVDVNFIARNNFNNNAYRGNFASNPRPFPSTYGNKNTYPSNKNPTSELKIMFRDFITTQKSFHKNVEEKLDKLDNLCLKVDSLA